MMDRFSTSKSTVQNGFSSKLMMIPTGRMMSRFRYIVQENLPECSSCCKTSASPIVIVFCVLEDEDAMSVEITCNRCRNDVSIFNGIKQVEKGKRLGGQCMTFADCSRVQIGLYTNGTTA